METEPIYTVPATRVRDGAHFGKLLRLTRTSAGLTIKKMAAQLFCVEGTVILRELGQRNVTVADAVRHLELAGYDLVVMRSGQIVGPDAVPNPQAR